MGTIKPIDPNAKPFDPSANPNMIIYDQVRHTPENAKRPIKAGKLIGKTDINPQFRIETLTKIFGPVGIGWYFKVLRMHTIASPDTQELMCFVDIELFYKWGGEWSMPVFGTGGSTLIDNFRTKGIQANDDGFKMATTDAISVACKELGISADVYWDAGETKYSREIPADQDQSRTTPAEANSRVFARAEETAKRRQLVSSTVKSLGLTSTEFIASEQDIVNKCGFDLKVEQMTEEQFAVYIKAVNEVMKGKMAK